MVACDTLGDERLTALVEGVVTHVSHIEGLKGGKLFVAPELAGQERCQSLEPMTL